MRPANTCTAGVRGSEQGTQVSFTWIPDMRNVTVLRHKVWTGTESTAGALKGPGAETRGHSPRRRGSGRGGPAHKLADLGGARRGDPNRLLLSPHPAVPHPTSLGRHWGRVLSREPGLRLCF